MQKDDSVILLVCGVCGGVMPRGRGTTFKVSVVRTGGRGL